MLVLSFFLFPCIGWFKNLLNSWQIASIRVKYIVHTITWLFLTFIIITQKQHQIQLHVPEASCKLSSFINVLPKAFHLRKLEPYVSLPMTNSPKPLYKCEQCVDNILQIKSKYTEIHNLTFTVAKLLVSVYYFKMNSCFILVQKLFRACVDFNKYMPCPI